MLSELQRKIAQLYCGGDMAHVSSMEEAENCGDTLLLFLLRQAEDAETMFQFVPRLDTARKQLTDLYYAIDE